MKKLTLHKLISLLLCAAALFALCAVPAAAADKPSVRIDREEMEPVRPGEEFTLVITIHNADLNRYLNAPVVRFSPSEAFLIMDSVATRPIANIRQNQTATVEVKLLARDVISNPSQYVDVSVDYEYHSWDTGDSTDGTTTEKIFIPVVTSDTPTPPPEESAPTVVISRDDLDTVKAGEAFTLNVKVTNKGTVALESPVFAVSVDSGLSVLDSTMSRPISNIQPGATVTVPVKLKVADKPASTSQSVDVSLNYLYGTAHTKGTGSETILVPVELAPEEQPEAPTPAPQVVISRDAIDTVKAGETFTLNVKVTNKGPVALESPVFAVSVDSGLSVLDSTMSRPISNIQPGATITVPVKLKVADKPGSASQSVDVSLNYLYGTAHTKGTGSETILVPVELAPEQQESPASAPQVVISRGELSSVKANQAFTLNVKITNKGTSPLESPVLSVTPDSALCIMDATMSRPLENVQPGATVTVPVNLKAGDRVSAPSLPVALELSYACAGSKGSSTETVFVPATPNADKEDEPVRIEGATPNVIISQYSYGDEPQVAAGSSFDLSMEFRNTSATFTVENIVMTVSTGEGLTISSSSNTMYYASLRAGDTQDQVIGITVLPTAKTGSASIDVSFSYEYVDNQQRCKVNTTQSIAVPVYQPDRFEVELPALPEFVTAYEEMYISMPYVNKGKSEISNVRAELISPDGSVSAVNGVQNLGNFGPGSSGTIDFIFTPQMSGQVDFSFAITYEDPNAQEKTVEFPVSLTVDEPYYPEWEDPGYDPGWEEPVEEKAGIPWWVWVIAAVVVAALVVVILVSRKKKSKKNGDLDSFEWNPEALPEDDVTAGGTGK